MIDHLADADGHIIEPGDLWAERLPQDLRPLAPRFYRDPEGVFHSRLYARELHTLPHLAPAVCAVYNDWSLDHYCGGSGGRLVPVATLPTIDVEAAVAEVHRVAERGFPAVFIRTNPVFGRKYSDRSFDPLWQAIVDTGVKLGLHPLPMWDQDGTSKGYKLPDIMAASCLGFPMDMMHTLYDMMAAGASERFP